MLQARGAIKHKDTRRLHDFTSLGMHFPNGSFVTFGGNAAVGPGSNPPANGYLDPTFQAYSGLRAIRLLNPCQNGDSIDKCNWQENSTFMTANRWYAAAEALGDGSVVIVGG